MIKQKKLELSLPEYETLASVLLHVGVYDEPARVHGLLSGLIVSTGGIDIPACLQLMGPGNLEWNTLEDDSREILSDLIETTLSQFHDPQWRFSLLLPDDDERLEDRVRAFGLWCDGFVEGITAEGHYVRLTPSAEIDEMMQDLQEMSVIDDDVSEEEDQEKALVELQEYVKVAVLLLQDEFAESRGTTKKVTEALH